MTKRDLINLLGVEKDRYIKKKEECENNKNFTGRRYYAGAIYAINNVLLLVKDLEEDQLKYTTSLERDIAVLGLSNRTYNSLKRHRIDTLGDLSKHTKFSLLRLRGMGKTSVKEIIDRCADLGVHLGGDTKQRKEKNVTEDDEFEKYIAESIENDICNDPEFEKAANRIFSTNVKEQN